MREVFSAYLRRGLGLSFVFALLMTLATAFVVGAPKYQERLFEEETAHAVGSMAAISRSLQAETSLTARGMPLPTVPLDEEYAPIHDLAFPPVLRSLTGPGHVAVGTKGSRTFVTSAAMPSALRDRELAFIADTEALGAVEFIRGAAPAPNPIEVQAREITDQVEMWQLLEQQLNSESPPLEIALSASNAEILGLDVGDEIAIGGYMGVSELVISGVFEPADPQALIWQVHLRALAPFIDDDPNFGKTALGAALINPDTPGWLSGISESLHLAARIPISPVVADTDALAGDLQEFTSARHVISSALDPLEFTSSLAHALSELSSQRGTAQTALRAIIMGPLGATLAAGALMARVSRHRRRAEHSLMAARGASGRQLRGLSALHGAFIGLPAVVIGSALGSPLGGTAMALIPTLMFALTPFAPARRSKVRTAALTAATLGVFTLTGASIYVASNSEPDPLTIVLPILLAASIAILTLGAIPLIMRPLHKAAGASRGLLAFLGTARATRESGAGWPILTLVIALGAGIFASTTLTTVTEGARASAFEAVGADVRLNTGWLYPEDEQAIADTPGVEAAASVHRLDATHVGTPATHRRATILIVDTEELARAQVNLPGARDLSELAVTDSDRIPAITSPGLLTSTQEQSVHIGAWLPIDVRAEVADVPGVSLSGVWMIMDGRHLPDFAWEEIPLPRLMLLGTDGTSMTAEHVHERAGGVMSTPLEALAHFAASPVVSGLGTLSWWALVFSAVLAGFAVILFLSLTAPDRTYTDAIVQTQGGRVSAGLVAWEAIPVVVGGLAGGILAGIALPHVLRLDLSVFTGGTGEVTIIVDTWQSAGITAGVLGIVALAILVDTLTGAGKRQQALRIGE